MKRKSLLMSLLILSLLVPLFSASFRERDDYAYIIELYDMQDYAEALDEMDYFVQTYPDSEFRDYLDYIKANIALAQADYPWLKSFISRLPPRVCTRTSLLM